MRFTMTAISACALLGAFAAPTYADDDRDCGPIQAKEWMSTADIVSKASAMGLDVREVERDDGCFEVKARDAAGMRIELRLHPVSAEVVQRSERSADDDWDD